MSAIIKRELSSYFNSAIGYIVLAVFYFFSGLFFYMYRGFLFADDLRFRLFYLALTLQDDHCIQQVTICLFKNILCLFSC